MHEELVKTLREQCSNMDCGNCNTCVKLKAADAIEELQSDNAVLREAVSNFIKHISELSKPRWVPVAEKLPDEYAVVLLLATTGEVIVGYYDSEHKIYCDMSGFRRLCTHWMLLPEPPMEDETCTKTNEP